ncbi:MAG: PilZ domain-containing protein [Deltaproteobacteria bacterium]|nr:PilZ domain-containing protein [Deltaproteobacteria bacterium]
MIDGIEKRIYSRKAFFVEITIIESNGTGAVIKGGTLNLSRGGICATIEKPLEKGDIVKFGLPKDGPCKDLTLPEKAEIRWVVPAKEEGHFKIGIMFVE